MLARPPILAPHAAIATAHPLASMAGIEMLRRGGTAADAAVAAGAVLCVVEPWASHIGGDAFVLTYDSNLSSVRAIQGSGRSPAEIGRIRLERDRGAISHGAGSVAVPGMVGAWFHLHSTRGRLPRGEVLEPAIALAAEGFPANRRWERIGRIHHATIAKDESLCGLFGSREQPRRLGDPVRQPDLAETLRGLADNGAPYLYQGPLGERITQCVRSRSGALGVDDLSAHRTEETEPLIAEVSGVQLFEQPPVSQGAMVIAAMRALEAADRRGWRLERRSPTARAREIHLQVEIYRRVRSYRDRFLCDPHFADANLQRRFEHWLSSEHAEGTADRIDPHRCAASLSTSGERDIRDTTYLCVVDSEGSIVSLIQSIFHPFGAGFIVPGTGILLNNRLAGFSTDPASPNRLEAGKRTIHTLNSWIVMRGGIPWLVGGTPGAERQIQTNIQILRGRIVEGIELAEAVEAPRWMLDEQDRLALEGRGPAKTRKSLARMGHDTVRIGPWDGSGYVQALERVEGGWLACTDPRGEGLAVGT